MDKLDRYRVFKQVAEMGSFIRAAHSLNLPRASVSSAVQQLEDTVGVRLLNRTTRKVSLTPDGEVLLDRIRSILADSEEIEQLFRTQERHVVGRLKVSVPSRIARRLIAPALPAFLRRHQQLSIGLSSTDRMIDLVHDGVDCAVRVGVLSDSSLAVRPIGRLALLNCASAAYVRERGMPRDISELAGSHAVIGYASPTTGREEPWKCAEGESEKLVEIPSRVVVDNADSYIACCLSGMGLIQVPHFDVKDLLVSGKLVDVLPDFKPLPIPISFVYPHRRHRSRRLVAFMEWFEALVRPHLE